MTANKRKSWKGAAKKLGITVEEYAAHRIAEEVWCTFCQAWKPREEMKPGQKYCKWHFEKKGA